MKMGGFIMNASNKTIQLGLIILGSALISVFIGGSVSGVSAYIGALVVGAIAIGISIALTQKDAQFMTRVDQAIEGISKGNMSAANDFAIMIMT